MIGKMERPFHEVARKGRRESNQGGGETEKIGRGGNQQRDKEGYKNFKERGGVKGGRGTVRKVWKHREEIEKRVWEFSNKVWRGEKWPEE